MTNYIHLHLAGVENKRDNSQGWWLYDESDQPTQRGVPDSSSYYVKCRSPRNTTHTRHFLPISRAGFAQCHPLSHPAMSYSILKQSEKIKSLSILSNSHLLRLAS